MAGPAAARYDRLIEYGKIKIKACNIFALLI